MRVWLTWACAQDSISDLVAPVSTNTEAEAACRVCCALSSFGAFLEREVFLSRGLICSHRIQSLRFIAGQGAESLLETE